MINGRLMYFWPFFGGKQEDSRIANCKRLKEVNGIELRTTCATKVT